MKTNKKITFKYKNQRDTLVRQCRSGNTYQQTTQKRINNYKIPCLMFDSQQETAVLNQQFIY